MRIDILTLFPDVFAPLFDSILGRAQQKELLSINIVDIRKYSKDKHFKCDDYAFGGGAGMVMTPQPIFDCIADIDPMREATRIYMSPKGTVLTHQMSVGLSLHERLLILCGHYEGVDQRVLDMCFDCEISIGDYVLTGGELPAMVLCDCVARHIEGVLGSNESAKDESFCHDLLEYPQYTRPQVFEGVAVPEVLLSGHHQNIEDWRQKKSMEITAKNRPDLWEKYLKNLINKNKIK